MWSAAGGCHASSIGVSAGKNIATPSGIAGYVDMGAQSSAADSQATRPCTHSDGHQLDNDYARRQ